MGRFIKSDKMAGVTSVNQLLKIDVQAKENHNVYNKIDAWFRAVNEADSVSDNDDVIQQYSQYIDETVVPRCLEHTNFRVSTSRLDELLFDTMANNSSAHKLWSCVRMFLLLSDLSHGQASVGRGFSVNKQIELDNLAEDTFVTSVGGLQNIDASDKHLLLTASSARQKYLSYLEGEKKKKECSGRGQKRKLLNDEIDELKKKKTCLQTDIDSLTI